MKKYIILLTLVVSVLAWHEAHHSMMRSKLSNITIENIEALTNEEYVTPNERYGFKLVDINNKETGSYWGQVETNQKVMCCRPDNWYSVCNAGLQSAGCN